ncbi:hypothetical protein M427DRAFT_335063 [Gonapodya prolifera JEL478]|uniref:Uncharacterized protein n=1 Tax=Gonapodya prolifera (strain JEL478) TaxID=1344416 RepID=A0A139ADK8_GONPJ|nr:hypothetical protein M427DRAFT_335063 [Gonapodya prolifera JEL478]|eukprot:KXS14838.1 hypothetical protein M427DRAFT_335063 [Gonapodya prolifera JEL478]
MDRKENPGLPVTPVLAPAGWVPPSFGAGAVPTVGSFPAAFGISFPQTPASIRTLSLEDLASLSFFYNHTLGLPVGGGGMGSEELLERGRKGLARMCGVAWTSVDAGRGESKGEMEGVQKESAVVAGDAKDKEMGDEKVGANPGTREAQTQEPPRNKRPAPQSRSPDAPVEKKLKPVQHRDLTKDFNVHPPEATATATVQVGGKKVQQTVEEEGEEEKMEGVQKEKNDAGEEGGVAA